MDTSNNQKMSLKPTCPDCGEDCFREDMAEAHSDIPIMTYSCLICKTWVYDPEWIEDIKHDN